MNGLPAFAPPEAPMISFSCSHCGMKLKVKPEFAGRSSKCPTCKQPLVVPLADKTQADVAAGEIEGTSSSLVQAGVDGGVTLEQSARPGSRSVRELLARRPKGGERYIVEGEIARGGMGAVIRAVDCDIRREVAVKYLLDQSDPKKKARFVEEAQITGQLEHPNIVPIHELGVDAKKRLFFSMKMVKGRSLAQVLDELRQNPKTAEKEYSLGRLLNIIVNVCNALNYAHSCGVVHRDLKPANVMIGDFGEVYVMDWGLAKVLRGGTAAVGSAPMAALVTASPGPSSQNVSTSRSNKVVTSREAEADLTQEGAVLGTPVYMPPEQATGQVQAVDQRSDIYSLGAILYEMLALKPPVEREGGYLDVLMRVMQGEIVSPEQRNPQRARGGKIPKELSAIAMKALAKNPQDRYPTIEALRKDIERFQEGRSVSAKEDTKREMLVKFVKRNRGFSAGAVLSLTVLLCSVGVLAKAYAELKSERQARRDQGRASVPSFVRAGQMLLNESRFSDALAQADVALDFDPQAGEAKLLRGHALIGQLRYADAGNELDACLKLRPDDLGAKSLAERCKQINKENSAGLLALADELNRQKILTVADELTRQAGKLVKSRNELLPHYRKRIESVWKEPSGRLDVGDDGFRLDLGMCRQHVTDLSPLKGMPLVRLSLLQCDQVRDLSPLKGMPLTDLDLGSCKQISDLTPLQGMPLTRLNLDTCQQVRDLTPLRGMPLISLSLQDCGQVQDLTPLQGMKLTSLNLINTAVLDLMPLKGVPLTNLNLFGCGQVRDLTPLQGMKLTSLNLTNTAVLDLTPLKGLPLTTLSLHGCRQVSDLTQLKDLPLTSLDISHCDQVRDLTPLKGMRLTSLSFYNCGQARDVTPLQGMKLTFVLFTPQNIAKGMDVLRQMDSLKTIAVGSNAVRLKAEEFWKRYDAGEFK